VALPVPDALLYLSLEGVCITFSLIHTERELFKEQKGWTLPALLYEIPLKNGSLGDRLGKGRG